MDSARLMQPFKASDETKPFEWGEREAISL